ncbi:MAG: endolytic transglycosylase MltG [Candidatus Paceibacterota bacterium]
MSLYSRSPLTVVVGLTVLAFLLLLAYVLPAGFFNSEYTYTKVRTGSVADYEAYDRFPIGVDPEQKIIVENPVVEWYVGEHLSIDINRSREKKFIDKLFANLSKSAIFQQLASPMSRILVIYPGERREEVVKNFGDILKWNTKEREEFSTLITTIEPVLVDGKFFPGRYTVPSKAKPSEVAILVVEKFVTEILARYDEEVAKQVPIEQALIIASLLEREAYDFADMRYISGIIWNRLFVGMPLQLDATLQYAKGSQSNETKWWPKVVPSDKYINSAFNTYENVGLPPSPIANPSLEAVVAALNPKVTECMFYFHDTYGGFYCSKTYPEHVAKLKAVFGQGK